MPPYFSGLLPEGPPLRNIPPRVELNDFNEMSFAKLLREQGLITERIGIAGFQDKESAAVLNIPNGMWQPTPVNDLVVDSDNPTAGRDFGWKELSQFQALAYRDYRESA